MFERFTDTARHVVAQAQEDARGLGHGYIGCEHLLLAAAAAAEPACAVLRGQGVTPERIKAEILRASGPGQTAGPAGRPGREALATSASTWTLSAPGSTRRSAGPPYPGPPGRPPQPTASPGEGPAGRADVPPAPPTRPRNAPLPAGPFRQRPASAGLVPGGHIPFTPRAKKTLALSLREAEALHDNYIGVQHLTLALLRPQDGTVPVILSALGAPAAPPRAAILARYRKAS